MPTATPRRPSKTSHARRLRSREALNAPTMLATPETSANAPNSAISAVRPMSGQMRMTTANAIASSAAQRRDLPDASQLPLAFLQLCFQVHVLLLSLQVRRQFVGLLFELVASRADAGSSARARRRRHRACLRKAVVDRDPSGADVGDRRLGPLARLPRPSPRSSPAAARGRCPSCASSSSTAAANVVQSSETSATSEFSATASLVLSCPSFSSTSSGASRAAARTDASSWCSASR